MVVQAMKQETFTDIEYSFRKKKTKREEFLEIMDKIIPWDEWVGVIEPYYPKGKRGRPPMGIEKMLWMYLLQIWFNLSDPATEDAIYDSYAMRKLFTTLYSCKLYIQIRISQKLISETSYYLCCHEALYPLANEASGILWSMLLPAIPGCTWIRFYTAGDRIFQSGCCLWLLFLPAGFS